MSEQIRREKEIVGKKDESAFKLSRETEQRLIREFQSPFPKDTVARPDGAFVQNACWSRRAHG